MYDQFRVLTPEQRALNRATHFLEPAGHRCQRCGMCTGTPTTVNRTECEPCPTFVEQVLHTLVQCRPYVVAADRAHDHEPPSQLPRLVLYRIDHLMRCMPFIEDDAFVIWFEDADRAAEVFSGHGATRAAWLRWLMLQDQWTCNLFKRIAGPNKRDIKVPPPRDINETTTLAYWKDDPPVDEADLLQHGVSIKPRQPRASCDTCVTPDYCADHGCTAVKRAATS